MLVLRRKIGEVVTVGDPRTDDLPIEITLLSVRGEIVEIGVEAPAGVSVEKKSKVVSGRVRRQRAPVED